VTTAALGEGQDIAGALRELARTTAFVVADTGDVRLDDALPMPEGADASDPDLLRWALRLSGAWVVPWHDGWAVSWRRLSGRSQRDGALAQMERVEAVLAVLGPNDSPQRRALLMGALVRVGALPEAGAVAVEARLAREGPARPNYSGSRLRARVAVTMTLGVHYPVCDQGGKVVGYLRGELAGAMLAGMGGELCQFAGVTGGDVWAAPRALEGERGARALQAIAEGCGGALPAADNVLPAELGLLPDRHDEAAGRIASAPLLVTRPGGPCTFGEFLASLGSADRERCSCDPDIAGRPLWLAIGGQPAARDVLEAACMAAGAHPREVMGLPHVGLDPDGVWRDHLCEPVHRDFMRRLAETAVVPMLALGRLVDGSADGLQGLAPWPTALDPIKGTLSPEQCRSRVATPSSAKGPTAGEMHEGLAAGQLVAFPVVRVDLAACHLLREAAPAGASADEARFIGTEFIPYRVATYGPAGYAEPGTERLLSRPPIIP